MSEWDDVGIDYTDDGEALAAILGETDDEPIPPCPHCGNVKYTPGGGYCDICGL